MPASAGPNSLCGFRTRLGGEVRHNGRQQARPLAQVVGHKKHPLKPRPWQNMPASLVMCSLIPCSPGWRGAPRWPAAGPATGPGSRCTLCTWHTPPVEPAPPTAPAPRPPAGCPAPPPGPPPAARPPAPPLQRHMCDCCQSVVRGPPFPEQQSLCRQGTTGCQSQQCPLPAGGSPAPPLRAGHATRLAPVRSYTH